MDAESRLLALRKRLRDTAAHLTPLIVRGPVAADASTQSLRDIDAILAQTRTLAAALARANGPGWHEADELTGRIVLRDLSLVTAGLRRILDTSAEELERARTALRGLTEDLTSFDEQAEHALADLAARGEKSKKPPRA